MWQADMAGTGSCSPISSSRTTTATGVSSIIKLFLSDIAYRFVYTVSLYGSSWSLYAICLILEIP